jgi:signal transduction histidine kinase
VARLPTGLIAHLPSSIAARLVLGYGVLGMASMAVVSAVFYFGTIGVLDHNLDGRITVLSDRLIEQYRGRPQAELANEVGRQLSDGIDSDSEIFLLLADNKARLAGNLTVWPQPAQPGLSSREVVRDGRPTPARLLVRQLDGGGTLVVGRDLSEQESVRALVLRSLAAGAALSLLLTGFGAMLFRRQIERRIGEIRHTAKDIEEGDLSRRISVSGDDEFSLLNRDINRMLDRIEHLMDGIRHVSNAIAHDLRTPLSRIRSKLDDALRHDMTVDALAGAAHGAIEDIDDLIRLFERLLQIAEAESGMRSQLFETIDLNRVARDMADMYEATAEDHHVTLVTALAPDVHAVQAPGDRNLLASAVASLIDNAIKYAGPGSTVSVQTALGGGMASIAVRDNGPGIPAAEFGKVTQRFYRLDKSRSLPGNGLGLSIVSATASMHGGTFTLEDGEPGLLARISLPCATLVAPRLVADD